MLRSTGWLWENWGVPDLIPQGVWTLLAKGSDLSTECPFRPGKGPGLWYYTVPVLTHMPLLWVAHTLTISVSQTCMQGGGTRAGRPLLQTEVQACPSTSWPAC